MSFTVGVPPARVLSDATGGAAPQLAPTAVAARIEWPTIGVLGVVFGGWLALTSFHRALPGAATVFLLGWFLAWSSSLQHEILHGHLTPWRWVNTALGRVTFELWLPFDHYRVSHLRHHQDDRLTDPVDDPESYYVRGERWERAGWLLRTLWRTNRTLLGRLVIGPWLSVPDYVWTQLCEVMTGRGKHGEGDPRRRWAIHGVYVAATVTWLSVVDIVWWQYGLSIWIAQSFIKLRSFLEHQWLPTGRGRTSTVASRGPLALLFLNNNLHTAHHLQPGMAWFRLPAFSRSIDAEAIADEGPGSYPSYFAVLVRFGLRPFDGPVFPPDRQPFSVTLFDA